MRWKGPVEHIQADLFEPAREIMGLNAWLRRACANMHSLARAYTVLAHIDEDPG